MDSIHPLACIPSLAIVSRTPRVTEVPHLALCLAALNKLGALAVGLGLAAVYTGADKPN